MPLYYPLWGIRKKVGNNDLRQGALPTQNYRDGTTVDWRNHVTFEPLNFIAGLAALVPTPRVNLMRLHGICVRGGHFQTVETEWR